MEGHGVLGLVWSVTFVVVRINNTPQLRRTFFASPPRLVNRYPLAFLAPLGVHELLDILYPFLLPSKVFCLLDGGALQIVLRYRQ